MADTDLHPHRSNTDLERPLFLLQDRTDGEAVKLRRHDHVATLAGGLWPQSNRSLGARRTFQRLSSLPRSLGTTSSSRCQTTRATQWHPWNGTIAYTRFLVFTDEHSRRISEADWRHRWWSQTESNRRPPACKAGALPTELWPRTAVTQQKREWWAWEDLNFRPHAYQARALTN